MPLDELQMPEHPLAVFDFAGAQAAPIRPVQAGRVGFQAVIAGRLCDSQERKANDHAPDSNGAA